MEFTTNVVNLLNTPELPEKSINYEEQVQKILNKYFNDMVAEIKENKAWKLMGLSPQEYTFDKFKDLDVSEKFLMLKDLNRKYSDFLKTRNI